MSTARHRLFAATPEDKPAWLIETAKAVAVAVLMYLATNFFQTRSDTEHRLTVTETKMDSVQKDVGEIKQDVKDILKEFKQ